MKLTEFKSLDPQNASQNSTVLQFISYTNRNKSDSRINMLQMYRDSECQSRICLIKVRFVIRFYVQQRPAQRVKLTCFTCTAIEYNETHQVSITCSKKYVSEEDGSLLHLLYKQKQKSGQILIHARINMLQLGNDRVE